MRLKDTFQNEFGDVEGIAFFPYFNREISVICRKGVSSEYVEKCLQYLEEADEALILQICKYAEFFLKDTLYIDEPPQSIAESLEINVLNLSGGCDWWEDEGLQCLVKNGKVLYLGYFENLNIWQSDYSENYHGN